MHTAFKGTMQVGLLAIPVRLGVAVGDKDTVFHFIHKGCGGRARFSRDCDVCGAENLEFAAIGKGVERTDGVTVEVTDAELDELPGMEAKTIRIMHFTDPATIEPMLLDKPYFAEPIDGGGRAYALLLAALELTGQVAICRIAFRERESLAVLHPVGPRLIVTACRWPAQLRAADPFNLDKPDPREVKMAVSLVESMTRPFDQAEHVDTYFTALMALVTAKLAGEAPKASAPKGGRAHPAPDLTAVLQESVKMARADKANRPKPTGTARTTRTRQAG